MLILAVLELVTRVAKLACLVLVALILGIVAWNLPYWIKASDLILKHADQFAGRGEQAMAKLRDASGQLDEAAKNSNLASQESLKRIQQLDTTLARADQAMAQMRTSLSDISEQTVASLDNFDRQLTAISSHSQSALDSLPPTLQAGQAMFASTTRLLDGSVHDLFGNTNNVLVPTALLMSDTQRKVHSLFYPAAYQGRFGKLHTAWTGVRTVLPLTEPIYFGVKLLQGAPGP